VATKCFFFTTKADGKTPARDLAPVSAAYVLEGRWIASDMTQNEWGLAGSEGPVDAHTRYPVFAVERICINSADATRQEKLLAELKDAAPPDSAATRKWLAANRCPSKPPRAHTR